MIFTVSTVKDTPANVAAYCRRNLDAGADHLLLFLDAPDPDVEEMLTADPHVTHVVTTAAYWTPKRPESLNARQVTNANLAMSLLAGFEWADWIFHIDADECLQLDRAKLLTRVPEDKRVVRVAPLEAVSQMAWDGEVTHFKPMLDRPTIDQLVTRGVIAAPDPGEPDNATWFRGHVQGKIGVRPNLDLRMQLHRAVWQGEETVVPAFGRPWLQHRHYESHSGEEFVRKWMAQLGAGPIRLRARRGRLMEAISAIVDDASLDEVGRTAALTDLYHREVEDDLPALLELGVLTEPEAGSHRPEDFPPGGRAQLQALLDRLVAADKRYHNPQVADLWPVRLFEQLRSELGADDPLLSVLDRAIDDGHASEAERGVSPVSSKPGRFLRRR